MLDKFNLTGKKAIVTGGSIGLGKAMVEALHSSGVEVAIIDISEQVFETAKEIGTESLKVHPVQGDLGKREELKEVFDMAVTSLGGELDILINNAGICRRAESEEFPSEYWNDVLEINLSAVFHLCQLAGLIMLKKGNGKIINMASMLSFFGGKCVPSYAASKGGVAQLTKALSNEWACKGINVNALAPGYMSTPMNVPLINDLKRNEQIISRIAKGRWGTPEDVKGIVVFLSSEASDYITGAIIPVDGGYLVM